MEEISEGVLEEMEEITSSVKPSGPIVKQRGTNNVIRSSQLS